MNTLITICARGGSKGLPDKHIRMMHGKPLIAWTIEHAQKWMGYCFKERGSAPLIVLSTDCPKIKAIGREYEVEIIDRPAKLAEDDTPKMDVLRHALKRAKKKHGGKFDCVVDLDATNPMRKTEDIEGCYQIFTKNDLKTVFSVTKSRKSPFFNMVFGDCHVFTLGGNQITRRQEAPTMFDLNANIYVYKSRFLLPRHP